MFQSTTGGVYGEEERRFQFRNVIVGRTSKARFKIVNSQKVPVDITLNLRPTNKGQKVVEAFELDVHRAQIPAYSSHYAVVSFTPGSMQSYSALFEVTVDGQARTNRDARVSPNLFFELHGEGHLPRVSIIRPAIRNKKAQTMMIFNKLLLGRQANQTLVLLNDGVLPAKVSRWTNVLSGRFSFVSSGRFLSSRCRRRFLLTNVAEQSESVELGDQRSDAKSHRRFGDFRSGTKDRFGHFIQTESDASATALRRRSPFSRRR